MKDEIECIQLEDIMPKGFIRPVGVYCVNALEDGADLEQNDNLISEVGNHVRVEVYNRHKIRESIVELKKILNQFEKRSKL